MQIYASFIKSNIEYVLPWKYISQKVYEYLMVFTSLTFIYIYNDFWKISNMMNHNSILDNSLGRQVHLDIVNILDMNVKYFQHWWSRDTLCTCKDEHAHHQFNFEFGQRLFNLAYILIMLRHRHHIALFTIYVIHAYSVVLKHSKMDETRLISHAAFSKNGSRSKA